MTESAQLARIGLMGLERCYWLLLPPKPTIPAIEGLVIAIPIVALHRSLELAAGDGFKHPHPEVLSRRSAGRASKGPSRECTDALGLHPPMRRWEAATWSIPPDPSCLQPRCRGYLGRAPRLRNSRRDTEAVAQAPS